MNSIQFKLAEDISEADLISKIEELNNDKNVHGILVQLPLPKHIDAKKLFIKLIIKKMLMVLMLWMLESSQSVKLRGW